MTVGSPDESKHQILPALTVHLRDINTGVVKAWEQAFADAPGVFVSRGDIFEQKADAIVSPANSFGYMDGGIDLLYSKYFGWELEANLRALLSERHYGELPVGQAVVLATGHEFIPFLVSAPTMRVPMSIGGTVNVYLAFRAALIAVLAHNASAGALIRSLLVPGLGTGIGRWRLNGRRGKCGSPTTPSLTVKVSRAATPARFWASTVNCSHSQAIA